MCLIKDKKNTVRKEQSLCEVIINLSSLLDEASIKVNSITPEVSTKFDFNTSNEEKKLLKPFLELVS